MTPDAPMFRAADRNKDAILGVLREVLPATGTVLEIASGGGQHIAHFAAALPDLDWQPSETAPELVAHLNALSAPNILPALSIDVCRPDWPEAVTVEPNAVISANMIHIAPWEACLGLFAGSARLLPPGGVVFFYGPFRVTGCYSSQGNAAFDRSLRDQNPAWGLRDLEHVRDAASQEGFEQDRIVDMPVNNLSAVFRRQNR
jgi:hypothetical protein